VSAILANFGVANELSFDFLPGFVLVPGHTDLYTCATGPEGVLYKKITSLSDALECGGLAIFDQAMVPSWMGAGPANGRRQWRFFVGDMLRYILQRKLLNKKAAIEAGHALHWNPIKAFNGEKRYSNTTDPASAYCWDDVFYGGEFEANPTLIDYFASSQQLCAIGIITGAETGYADSHALSASLGAIGGPGGAVNPTSTIGFMASIVPMDVPFSKFATDVKQAMIALAPADLQQYYTATFADVLAAFPQKDDRPTISIPTFWADGALTNGAQQKPKIFQGDSGAPVKWVTDLVDNPPPGGWYSRSIGPGSYPPPAVSKDVPVQWRTKFRAGHWAKAGSTVMPMMDIDTFFCDSIPLPKLVGKVGGLDIGSLRDGHVLKRRLIDGLAFSSEVATQTTLDQVINPFIDQWSIATDDMTHGVQPPVTEADIDGVLTGAMASSKLTASVYCLGTLPIIMEAFSDVWDSTAKSYAKDHS